MTTAPVTKVVSIRIESITPPAEGAKFQQIKFFAEALGIRQYSSPTSVPLADIPELQTSAGPFLVKLERGKVMKDQHGEPKAGQYDNEFFWEWRGFGDPSRSIADTAADPSPQPEAQTQPPGSTERPAYVSDRERQENINWQSARRDAVAALDGHAKVTDGGLYAEVTDDASLIKLILKVADGICNPPLPSLVQAAVDEGGEVMGDEDVPPTPDDLPF